MVIIAHVPILLFELQMRAPRYPESGTEVAAAGRGTAPGGTRMGFPVTSVSICYPLFYFQMLNGFYRLQMECYPKCFCFVLGFFFPIALLGDVSVEKEIHYEQNSPIKCHLFG